MEPLYVPINIDVAIRYHRFFDVRFFIKKKLGDMISIHQKAIFLEKTFKSYKAKGLREIWLLNEDYHQIVSELRRSLETKRDFKEAFHDINSIYSLSRNILLEQGFNKKVIEESRTLNVMAIKHILEVPDLAALMVEFKKENDGFFFRYIMQSYIINSMIKTFPWYSEHLMIKMGEACMLCDITLSESDFDHMARFPMDKWTKKQYMHPVEVAEMLRKYGKDISPDVIKVIEQHHEKPDGTGYPRGLTHSHFTLLSSIFQISAEVAAQLENVDARTFDMDHLVQEIYQNNQKGVCRNASMALFSSLGLQL